MILKSKYTKEMYAGEVEEWERAHGKKPYLKELRFPNWFK